MVSSIQGPVPAFSSAAMRWPNADIRADEEGSSGALVANGMFQMLVGAKSRSGADSSPEAGGAGAGVVPEGSEPPPASGGLPPVGALPDEPAGVEPLGGLAAPPELLFAAGYALVVPCGAAAFGAPTGGDSVFFLFLFFCALARLPPPWLDR